MRMLSKQRWSAAWRSWLRQQHAGAAGCVCLVGIAAAGFALATAACCAHHPGPSHSSRLFTAVPAGSDVLLLLYISLLGSAASYGVFFYNASRGSLTALSSLTFLTPCFAAAGGSLALGATLTPLQLAGAAITLGSVALINNNSHRGDSQDGGSGEQPAAANKTD